MAENKIVPTAVSVEDYLAQVVPERRREDAVWLDEVFRDVSGFEPRMWGESIVGYGRYDYTYDSGRSGSFLATGFAPRKAKMVLYIMPGYADFSDILGELGPYKMGKACLYLGALSKINEAALRQLIRAGLDDLGNRWDVKPA